MCLRTVRILNPTKRLSAYGGTPINLEVPCGRCAECKESRRNEWKFRTWHEVTNCLLQGGFVYFDTLTYKDECLPHLSDYVDISEYDIADFSCFDRSHIQQHLKLLRTRLHRKYNGATLKYFITSEYGTDERYTHRPHYHPLYFVYPHGNDIDPYVFSELVADCWQYGRTDGIPYQCRSYVREHVYGVNLGQCDGVSFINACAYVSKYINKDSTFQKTIDNRVELLRKHYPDDVIDPIIRNINMFHRQSQGFGLSYIENLSRDEYNFIMNNGACRLNDGPSVVLTITLPMYYKRKLFYNLLKDGDSYIWQLNQKGKEYMHHRMLYNIEQYCDRIYTLIVNSDCDTSYIGSLLAGRTITDFAIYKLFYKGRYRVTQKPTLTDYEVNLHDWLNTILLSSTPYKLSHYETLQLDHESNVLDVPISMGLFSNSSQSCEHYSLINYLIQHTFNENSCPDFKDFDKLSAYLESVDMPNKKLKQDTFDFIEDLQNKYKIIYG